MLNFIVIKENPVFIKRLRGGMATQNHARVIDNEGTVIRRLAVTD